MTAPLKAIDGNADLPALMTDLGARARAAARVLALAPPEQKNRGARGHGAGDPRQRAAILAANAEDVAEARAGGADVGLPRPADADAGAGRGAWPTASRTCAASPIRSASSPRAGSGRTA